MLIGAGGSAAGSAFEVHPSSLTSVAGKILSDSIQVTMAVTDATGGAGAAVTACGGGDLAGALARFSAALTTHGGTLATAVEAASTTLTANASTYTSQDASAAGSFAAWTP